MEKKILKIRGNGEAILPPDMIEIQFILEARDTDYTQVITSSNSQLSQLQQCLLKESVPSESLETTNFSVETEFENIKNPSGDYSKIFRNYVAKHYLTLELNLNPLGLAQILQQISQCQAQPKITLRYKLKDQQKLLELALEDAYDDAFTQAQILTKKSGVILDEIIEIIHDEWMASPYPTKELFLQKATEFTSSPIQFHPENISLNASILVSWKLL